MEIAFLLVAIAITVLTVTAISERFEVPAPLTLVVVGVAASYVPGVPEIRLEPEVVLLGLLPPLLYSAAVNTSLVDFNANRRPILLLSVGLVAFTTFGVAAVVRVVIPEIGWPLALAIGAVVAPPDAVAATAIGRRIGLPRRIVTILEGESLLNDASALVALRTAVAALGTTVTAWQVGGDFVIAAGGGVLVGGLAFVIVGFLRKKVTDPLLDTAISLVIPFAAYIVAEEFHASGVVAVVVAGLLLGHVAPVLQTAPSRIAERTNWRTLAYVLENTVFLLIGLQADWLLGEVGDSEFGVGTIVAACAAAFVAVVVLRLVWVFASRYLLLRPGPDPVTGEKASWRYSFLIGWAGMRGVVTLAAAFTVPEHTEHREVLLIIAFTVVAGTLLGQGMTLPWVARRLRVPSPDPHDDALARATLLQQAAKAGIHRLDELAADTDDPHHVRELIIQRIEQRNFAAWERLGTTEGEESPSDLYSRWRGDMIEAERRRVLEIRSTGSVPSEIVSEVLAMLDVEESMLDAAEAARAELRTTARAPARDGCEHLAQAPLLDPPAELACADCLVEGTRWVALRMCLSCGEVGCCDSSPSRHATAHFRETQHPVMRSVEPGEDWRWCFVHHQTG
ncbi:Na+/H+ antiporter [Pimelobacter sp. 30-1]|uniref:Na+/H+ antiporter n=1 Tax=Pimelobacter sp. 30-1 TaxID=2004991 RepID=UPI001C03D721|nr:Na+/H+ antiporter [Pimelobacter sp. 30-1]MBU2695029.1 Na+/H+ antiporter [Pimelobacter sp. 30-1]